MSRVSFLGGLSCEINLPAGWTDRTIASFCGPEPQRMRASKTASIRTSLTVSAEPVPEETLEQFQASQNEYPGVEIVEDRIDAQPVPTYTRTLRFQDPMSGVLIQQRFQTLDIEDRRYTVVLSADPLRFRDATKTTSVLPKGAE